MSEVLDLFVGESVALKEVGVVNDGCGSPRPNVCELGVFIGRQKIRFAGYMGNRFRPGIRRLVANDRNKESVWTVGVI